MKEPKLKSQKNREVVSKRLSIIGPLLPLDPKIPGGDVKLFNFKLKAIAAENQISTRQLRRWVNLAREDPVQGLVPRYKGNARFSNTSYINFPQYVQRAVELRVANPSMTVADLIKKINQEMPASVGLIKRSTLQRHLQAKNVGKREMNQDPYLRANGYYNRFEMEHCLQLVQGDLKYLPKCLNEHGKVVKSYFVAWIDDKSRYVLSAGVFTSQEQYVVSTTLRSAVERYGRIEALYMDNGSIYRNRACHFAAKVLSIQAKHTRVRAAQAKGKVEFLNRNLSQLCHEIEDLNKIIDIKAMISLVDAWVDKYNTTPHSALNDCSPKEVFFKEWSPQTASFYPEEVIEAAFLDSVKRRVNKDGTVKYQNVYYKLPLGTAQVGSQIELAVGRNGKELAVSLIEDDLSLTPLERLELKATPNRLIEKRKESLQHKELPEPKSEDQGAAIKVKVMEMLKEAGFNYSFEGRNDLLDLATSTYLKSGSLDQAAGAVEASINGSYHPQATDNSEAGYACLLKTSQIIKGE